MTVILHKLSECVNEKYLTITACVVGTRWCSARSRMKLIKELEYVKCSSP